MSERVKECLTVSLASREVVSTKKKSRRLALDRKRSTVVPSWGERQRGTGEGEGEARGGGHEGHGLPGSRRASKEWRA